MSAAGRPVSSARSGRLLATAVVAVLGLSGCAGLTPGTAAVVGSSTISHDEVDDAAEVLCSVNLAAGQASGAGAQPAELATRGAREAAVQLLLETELSKQFAETEGVEVSQRELDEALASAGSGVQSLPAGERQDFRDLLSRFVEGQLLLAEVGRESLGQSGAAQDEAIAEGQRLRQDYVSGLDVEVDPRYGTFTDEQFRRGGTALSVPASGRSLAGQRANPPVSWVADLPASQKCS